jgi:biopolymer transport protein ExbD
MARFNRIRRPSEEEPELNMLPIMNLFMVLIPFLLTSVSFLHIKAINSSIPVHAERPAQTLQAEEPLQKITVVLEIKQDRVRLSTLSDTPNDLQVSEKEWVLPRQKGMALAVSAVADHLKTLKQRFPASDTMILIPDNEITYREIVQAMDCARMYQSAVLFPNVVLSGTLG